MVQLASIPLEDGLRVACVQDCKTTEVFLSQVSRSRHVVAAPHCALLLVSVRLQLGVPLVTLAAFVSSPSSPHDVSPTFFLVSGCDAVHGLPYTMNHRRAINMQPGVAQYIPPSQNDLQVTLASLRQEDGASYRPTSVNILPVSKPPDYRVLTARGGFTFCTLTPGRVCTTTDCSGATTEAFAGHCRLNKSNLSYGSLLTKALLSSALVRSRHNFIIPFNRLFIDMYSGISLLGCFAGGSFVNHRQLP